MTEPCTQKEEILELVALVKELKIEGQKTILGLTKLQSGSDQSTQNIERMCASHEKLAEEVKSINISISNSIADTREFKMSLSILKEDVDALFNKSRRLEDESVPKLSTLVSAISMDVEKIKIAIKNIDAITELDKRLAASENIITGIKVIAGGLALALVGIASAAIFGVR